MLQMIERGTDGIITDDPALAVRVIEELSTLTTLERLLLSFQPLLLEENERPQSLSVKICTGCDFP